MAGGIKFLRTYLLERRSDRTRRLEPTVNVDTVTDLCRALDLETAPGDLETASGVIIHLVIVVQDHHSLYPEVVVGNPDHGPEAAEEASLGTEKEPTKEQADLVRGRETGSDPRREDALTEIDADGAFLQKKIAAVVLMIIPTKGNRFLWKIICFCISLYLFVIAVKVFPKEVYWRQRSLGSEEKGSASTIHRTRELFQLG